MKIYGYINHADSLKDLSNQYDILLSLHCDDITGEAPLDRDSYAGLESLLAKSKSGDVIIVVTLNQLGRTVAQVIATLRECLDYGLRILVADIAMIDNGDQGELIIKALKSVNKL